MKKNKDVILSILICTIESRREKFLKLVSSLERQISTNDNYANYVEIISDCDNKQLTIGAKRQKLLEKAKGEYIVFIDDDDSIPDFYIHEIVKASKSKPDCIGFLIDCDIEGAKHKAIASNKYSDWSENLDGYKYNRTTYHKTPVRREIALQIGFKNERFGEDYDYSKRLKESGLLKFEEFIPLVMYYYNYSYEDKNTKYGFNKD